MKGLHLGAILGLTLALTACPPRDRVDPAVDDPAVRPGVEAPATAPADTVMAPLQEVGGSGVSGDVRVIPHDTWTGLVVTVQNAPPQQDLRGLVQVGTCEAPDTIAGNLQVIRTDAMGFGYGQTHVDRAPAEIMDGNHVVTLYAAGADPAHDRPIACSAIPTNAAIRR